MYYAAAQPFPQEPLAAAAAAAREAFAAKKLEKAAFLRAVQKELSLPGTTAVGVPRDSAMPAPHVALGGTNPQDAGSASSSPTFAQKKTAPAALPFGRSPSTPALASIKRSSSRLAFDSPMARCSSNSHLPSHASKLSIDDDAEDEDLWWGAGKRGGANDCSQKESLGSHNASAHYPPANVATDPR